jgi:hypothetical protein
MNRLMTRKQAEQILEDFDNACQSYAECEAEAGMGAVSMGFDGYNGMMEFRALSQPPQPDAEVIEARAVFDMFAGLEVYERRGGQRGAWLASHVVVPEFRPPTDSIPF